MRRDDKLVLVILRFVERFHIDYDIKLFPIKPTDIRLDNPKKPHSDKDKPVDKNEFAYHVQLLIEHGLLTGTPLHNPKSNGFEVMLTWAGHDYLDANIALLATDVRPYYFDYKWE